MPNFLEKRFLLCLNCLCEIETYLDNYCIDNNKSEIVKNIRQHLDILNEKLFEIDKEIN